MVKLISWNMAAGFNYDSHLHSQAWNWLYDQNPDVALLQEVVAPEDLDQRYELVGHTRKYDYGPIKWGSAVLVRTGAQYAAFTPDPGSWLEELAGSVSIARPETQTAPWLISIHSNAYSVRPERLDGRDITGIPVCKPGEIWEVEIAAHELKPLLRGHPFIAGGDLNSSLLFDKNYGTKENEILFGNLETLGFIDLRPRHEQAEVRSYFKEGRAAYQLDHLFADTTIEERVTSWSVASKAATELALSDHAPIVIEWS